LSTLETALRALLPLALALLAAWAFDHGAVRRGLLPPGFAIPWRRAAALSLLAFVLWVGILAGLGTIGVPSPGPDLASLGPLQLFGMHGLLVITMVAWYLLGFPAAQRRLEGVGDAVHWSAQLGWRTPSPLADLGVGVLAGVVIWAAVLAVLAAVAVTIAALGGEAWLPKGPPELVTWLAVQPLLLRLALAVSAGVVEETFFRGLLEPRLGLAATTVLFVLAHLSYDQPWMLFGVTLLSLSFSALCRWRQTIVPAVVAHTAFDAIQLLVAIPTILEFGGSLPVARP
jgi:membrane protease YdiL (CAAX protease family)